MSVYIVAEVEVTDESWMPEYAEKVHDIVHRYGGKYLARTANIVDLEGQSLPASIMAILEFPDSASVEAFATSAEYAPFAAARQAGSVSRLRLIDGTDVAGTIPYLKKKASERRSILHSVQPFEEPAEEQIDNAQFLRQDWASAVFQTRGLSNSA